MSDRVLVAALTALLTPVSACDSSPGACRDVAPATYSGTETIVGGANVSASNPASAVVGRPYKSDGESICGDAPLAVGAELAPACVLSATTNAAHWDSGDGDFVNADATLDDGQVCTLPIVGAVTIAYGSIEWTFGHARVVLAGSTPSGDVTYTFDGLTPDTEQSR